MPAVYEHLHQVRPDEIDVLGHASNVAYIDWMQQAALAHSAAQGWPGEAYQKLGQGWLVRSHEITYFRPALPAEQIVVRTWVATWKRITSLRRYDIQRQQDGALLAQAATEWVFVNFASGLPARVPPEILSAFELHEQAGDAIVARHLQRDRQAERRAAL